MTSTSGPLLAGAYTVTIDTHTSLRRSPKAVEVLPRFVHRLIFDALSNIVVERDVIYERTDDVENEPIAYAKLLVASILNVSRGPDNANNELLLVLRSHDIWRVRFQTEDECVQVYDKLGAMCRQPRNTALITGAFMAHALQPGIETKRTGTFKQPASQLMKCTERLPERWRLSQVNAEFQLCDAMPQHLVVPVDVDDATLLKVAAFRAQNRLPHVVYQHPKTNAILSRSSQPLMGAKTRRSIDDEQYLQCLLRSLSTGTSPSSLPCLVDVRIKSNAHAHKMRGGGYEADGNYAGIRMFFTNIEDASCLRDAYTRMLDAMRTPDISTTTFTTEITPWLRQIHSCLRPAIFLAKAIAVDGASALVHCDDGHDTTPILVSLAKIIMDPFYRTVDGWMCLVEEDWLQEGYRFGDADAVGIPGYSSQGTGNESPTLSSTISSAKTALTATFDSISSGINAMNVAHGGTPSMPSIPINTGANSAASFVLFLDCCHQLVTQFPLEFEYNLEMLMFTHQHSQASQFGNFLFSTSKERLAEEVTSKTASLWDFITRHRILFTSPYYRQGASGSTFTDHHYVPLPVTVNSKRLRLWNGFFDPFDTMNAHVEFHRFKHGLLCGFGDGDDPTDTAEDVESLYEKLGVPRVCVHIPSKGTVKVFGASHGQAKVRAMKLEVETLLCETAALCAR